MSENKPQRDPDAVLASVRRLVTQVQPEPLERPSAAGRAPASPPQTAPSGSEKLLLTPALRIDDAPPPSPVMPDPPVRRARVQTRTLTAERISLEQRIAELEQAVGERGGDWEPDGSELIDRETPDSFVFAPIRRAPETEAVQEHTSEPVPEPVNGFAQNHAEPVAMPDPGPKPEPGPKPAAMHAPAAQAAEAPSPFNATPEPGSGVGMGEESLIDEDILRDIVAEIVRSELQGELGERITRNVRKLVRREIHRAIMTRDFG